MGLVILSLPNEILLHIASFLALPDLVSCTAVCERMKVICKDFTLWRKFFLELKSQEPPIGRLCHSGVVYNNKMYIFGGHITQPDSEFFQTVKQDMYEYDIARKTWKATYVESEHTDTAPRRTEHSSIVYKDSMIVFGGYSGSNYENSVYEFSYKTQKWQVLDVKGDIPSPRSAHTAVLIGHHMYVFGGWNGFHCMNDMFMLDLETKTWSAVQPAHGTVAGARCSHGAVAINEHRDPVMYIFGGYSLQSGYLNDFHEFNIATRTWTPAKQHGQMPSPRSRFRMTSYDDKIYLFAGWNSQKHFSNLFKYTPSCGTWSEIETTFDADGIGQFSLVAHDDIMYVFSGFTPKVGSRTSLFAYPLYCS